MSISKDTQESLGIIVVVLAMAGTSYLGGRPERMQYESMSQLTTLLKAGKFNGTITLNGNTFPINTPGDMHAMLDKFNDAAEKKQDVFLEIADPSNHQFCDATLPARYMEAYARAVKNAPEVGTTFDINAVAGFCGTTPEKFQRTVIANMKPALQVALNPSAVPGMTITAVQNAATIAPPAQGASSPTP